MSAKILVTGASGMLGSAVAQVLAERGVPFAGSGRRAAPAGFPGEWRRADLLTGEGLADSLEGCSCIIHAASNPRRPDEDLTAIDRLMAEAGRQAVHLLHVGIAGIEDSAPHLAYYRVKLECERRLAAGGLPHAVQRATIFHPFLDQVLGRLALGPLLLVPPMTLQPVDLAFVADELVAVTLERPAGRVTDLQGPETLGTTELTRPWLARRGARLRLPAPPLGPLAALSKLRPVRGRSGGATWADWLASAS